MSEPIPITPARVIVSHDALLITDLVETDAEVLRFVASSEDPVAATRRCLQVGARSVQAASAALDSGAVQTEFDRLSADFGTCVGNAIDQIAAVTSGLLDEETGSLKAILEGYRVQLDEVLDARFDVDSKKSVMAEIEKIVAEALVAQNQTIRRSVSLDTPDSPLQVMKSDILAGFTTPIAELREQLRELSEKVAVNGAVAPVMEITSAKGFAFEEVVHEHVALIAAVHGDIAEMTGSELGVMGAKIGDEVVTLNVQDTNGVERRVVFEAKARKLNVRNIHGELDAALENRDAVAAIAVFDDQAKAPTAAPFHYSDNKAIVVFDGDDSALRLAYMWARWVARRYDTATAAGEIEMERVKALFDGAKRAIERHTTVKRAHTQARKGIDQASEQLQLLVEEVEDVLKELQDVLTVHEIAEG